MPCGGKALSAATTAAGRLATSAVRRIVAHHTILGLIPQAAVERKRCMALIATRSGDNLTSRLESRSIYGEAHDLILGRIGDDLLFGRARKYDLSAARFHSD